MIDTKLRYKFQPLFDFLGNFLIASRISPNMITITALTSGIISSVFIGFHKPVLALVVLWLSGLFDVLDGSTARLLGKSSKIGAYMDLIFDRMVEAAVILGFTVAFPKCYLAYILFLTSVIFNFTTFMLAGMLFDNNGLKSFHYDIGIAERTETFIVFSLMIIFTKYIFIILMIFNAIIFLTGIIRFSRIIKFIKD